MKGGLGLACLLIHSSRAMIRTTHSSSRKQLAPGAFWCPEGVPRRPGRGQAGGPCGRILFSEFGRTVSENGSAGTDHGTSGPSFSPGPNVNGGFVGTAPSLLDSTRSTATSRPPRLPPDLRHRPRGLAWPTRQGGAGRGFQKAASFPAPDDVVNLLGWQLPTVPSELVLPSPLSHTMMASRSYLHGILGQAIPAER